ncbi:MAG: metal-dependent transcriptional regulator [Bacteroidia bacterium]
MSITEENYLKALYHLGGQEGYAAPTVIALQVGATPGAVTEMLKRLAEKGYVEYIRYGGARLTPQGTKRALEVIRRHRLWEVFLVEKLGFHWAEVHPLAEELEHISSPKLIEALASFLGEPKVDPHGYPIPQASGEIPHTGFQRLSEVSPGLYRIVGFCQEGVHFYEVIRAMGMEKGVDIEVICQISYDGSMQVCIDGRMHWLSSSIAMGFWVQAVK